MRATRVSDLLLLASLLATIQAAQQSSIPRSGVVVARQYGFERVVKRDGPLAKRQRMSEDTNDAEDDSGLDDTDSAGDIVDVGSNGDSASEDSQIVLQTVNAKAIQASASDLISSRARLTRSSSISTSSTTSSSASTSQASTTTVSATPTTDTSASSSTSSSSSSTSSVSSAPSASSTSASASSTTVETVTQTVGPTSTVDATASTSSVPFTSIWSTFNKNSKWFPVAVIIAVVIGLGGLVAFVAVLQCCARMTGKKDRPLLIPNAEGWAANDDDAGSLRHQPSRASSYVSEKRPSDQPRRDVPQGRLDRVHRDSVVSTLSKEDFLPHSFDDDPQPLMPFLSKAHASPVTIPYPVSRVNSPFHLKAASHPPAFSQLSYSLPPSRRSTPAPAPMIYPYPASVPQIQRPASTAYPFLQQQSPAHYHASSPTPPRLPPLHQTPSMTPFFAIPAFYGSGTRSPSPAIATPRQHGVRHSVSGASSSQPSFAPRPGRGEQQSMTRASLNEQILQQQLIRLPPGVSERKRWERCAT